MPMQIWLGNEAAHVENQMLNPMTRYIVSDDTAHSLKAAFNEHSFPHQISAFDSYERRYAGQNANGKRIALMRSAAFGDTMIASPIPSYIRSLYPESRVDVYCAEKVASLWRDSGARVYATPLTFDAAMRYDYHIMLEHLFEQNSEPEQGNCYDDMYAFMGFDPKEVPVEFKRPILKGEIKTDWDELEFLKIDLSGKYIVYQIASGNPNRCYPPALGADVVYRLLKQFPDHRILVVGTKTDDFEIHFSMVARDERLVNLVGRTKLFTSMIPIVQNAKLVIGPDSSIGHLAAALNIPMISLWGIFDPNDRAKYYPTHRPIFEKSVCKFSPCRNHEWHLPQALCGESTNSLEGKQMFCNVMRAATPEKIVEIAEGILA